MGSRYLDTSKMFDEEGREMYVISTREAIYEVLSDQSDKIDELSTTVEENDYEYEKDDMLQAEKDIGPLIVRIATCDDEEMAEEIQEEIDDLQTIIDDYHEMLKLKTDALKELDSIFGDAGFDESYESLVENNGSDYLSWANEDESMYPMYNYVHPLSNGRPSADKMASAYAKYGQVVVEIDDDEYFIALTGCGMDMSQLIAMTYLELERWIPEDFISSVNTQCGLNVSGDDWKRLMSEIVRQSDIYSSQMRRTGVHAQKALDEKEKDTNEKAA